MTIEEVKLQFSGYIAAKKLVLELAAEKLRLRADMDALNQKTGYGARGVPGATSAARGGSRCVRGGIC